MHTPVRGRFWLEALLASLCGLLAILTLFWRDWIEASTSFDPDHHNGSLEWAIVTGLAAAAIIVAYVARTEWRRARAAAPTTA
jgi:hypothetical protein